jgi:hypothetical protein
MLGEIYYLTGGSKLFLILKTVHRAIFGEPPLVGACAAVLGYLKPLLSRKPLLVNDSEAKFYRQLLNRRILNGICQMSEWMKSKTSVCRYI